MQASDSVGAKVALTKWEEWQTVIQQRTGINDPEEFFKKFENQNVLEQQMTCEYSMPVSPEQSSIICMFCESLT